MPRAVGTLPAAHRKTGKWPQGLSRTGRLTAYRKTNKRPHTAVRLIPILAGLPPTVKLANHHARPASVGSNGTCRFAAHCDHFRRPQRAPALVLNSPLSSCVTAKAK